MSEKNDESVDERRRQTKTLLSRWGVVEVMASVRDLLDEEQRNGVHFGSALRGLRVATALMDTAAIAVAPSNDVLRNRLRDPATEEADATLLAKANRLREAIGMIPMTCARLTQREIDMATDRIAALEKQVADLKPGRANDEAFFRGVRFFCHRTTRRQHEVTGDRVFVECEVYLRDQDDEKAVNALRAIAESGMPAYLNAPEVTKIEGWARITQWPAEPADDYREDARFVFEMYAGLDEARDAAKGAAQDPGSRSDGFDKAGLLYALKYRLGVLSRSEITAGATETIALEWAIPVLERSLADAEKPNAKVFLDGEKIAEGVMVSIGDEDDDAPVSSETPGIYAWLRGLLDLVSDVRTGDKPGQADRAILRLSDELASMEQLASGFGTVAMRGETIPSAKGLRDVLMGMMSLIWKARFPLVDHHNENPSDKANDFAKEHNGVLESIGHAFADPDGEELDESLDAAPIFTIKVTKGSLGAYCVEVDGGLLSDTDGIPVGPYRFDGLGKYELCDAIASQSRLRLLGDRGKPADEAEHKGVDIVTSRAPGEATVVSRGPIQIDAGTVSFTAASAAPEQSGNVPFVGGSSSSIGVSAAPPKTNDITDPRRMVSDLVAEHGGYGAARPSTIVVDASGLFLNGQPHPMNEAFRLFVAIAELERQSPSLATRFGDDPIPSREHIAACYAYASLRHDLRHALRRSLLALYTAEDRSTLLSGDDLAYWTSKLAASAAGSFRTPS